MINKNSSKINEKILKILQENKNLNDEEISKKFKIPIKKIEKERKILEIIKFLNNISENDVDPRTGKLFAYVYETGNDDVRRVANVALSLFSEKNALDFTVFRSDIIFEKEIINFGRNLMHGNEKVVGTVTSGGTESIILATKAARDYYLKKYGKTNVPEILAPITIHPAWNKAADLLGIKIKKLPINEEIKVDVESIKNEIDDNTALIAISAPNWPFGTIDNAKEISEIAVDKKIPLHIDACVGGFILPFFEKLGENIPIFDFRLPGITSISLDAHKYGYSPKGTSLLLFSDSDFKKYSMFVDVSSPGYLFVNQAILSSRSIGPFAATYAVMKYLGMNGYENLAKKVLNARNGILSSLREIGFKSVGPVESSILSVFNEEIDLISFTSNMKKRGWHISIQRAIREYNIPLNLHMTISPIHSKLKKKFYNDSKESVLIPSDFSMKEFLEIIKSGSLENILKSIEEDKIDSGLMPILLEIMPQEMLTDIIKEIVIEWFK